MLNGIFDLQFRLDELSRLGDWLPQLTAAINWEQFRRYTDSIRPTERKSNAGRPPFDTVFMFKILVLQSLYNLSDDATEYQIRDRLSFMRFLGLNLGDRVPDAKTIWLFREQLREAELVEPLFELFDSYLAEHGFAARKGQIIDASIVQAPRQRNTRAENETIKETGAAPEEWAEKPAKQAQKDVDARWTQKNGINYYGYKNHISVDRAHKFIRRWAVTDAAVHDSQMLDAVLDDTNPSGDVWADSAYRSAQNEARLREWNYRPHFQHKAVRGRGLSAAEERGNRTRARVRARVEHVFGIQVARAVGNLLVRTIGLARARCKIGLRNLSYNLARFTRLRPAHA